MNTHYRTLCGIAAVALLPLAASASPTSVLVTNTAAQAVPVAIQGTTVVSGSVAATQQGAWNVGISGTPTVSISSASSVHIIGPAATSPIPVAIVNEGSRQPFQQQVQITTNQSSGIGEAILQVPAGWRLVVEHINAFIYVGQIDDILSVQLDTSYAGSFVSQEYGTTPASASDHYHEFLDQSILAYADAGSKVGIDIETSSSGGNAPTASGYVTIVGHIEK